MLLKEFTLDRANRLNEIYFPDIKSPLNVKIIWFMCIELTDDDILYNMHTHPCFEMHNVFSGELCYEVDGELVVAHENEAILIPPNTPHTFIRNGSAHLQTSLAFVLDTTDNPQVFIPDSLPKKFIFPEMITDNINFVLKKCEKDDLFTTTLIADRALEIIYDTLSHLGVEFSKNNVGEEPRLYYAKLYIYTITVTGLSPVRMLQRTALCRGSSLIEFLKNIPG